MQLERGIADSSMMAVIVAEHLGSRCQRLVDIAHDDDFGLLVYLML